VGEGTCTKVHLAGNFVAVGVAKLPFEAGGSTTQSLANPFLFEIFQGTALRLAGNADVSNSPEQQFLSTEPEQSQRIVVTVVESPARGIEHHDGFGRILHQRSITLLAFPQSRNSSSFRLPQRSFFLGATQSHRQAGKLIRQHVIGYALLDALNCELISEAS
jgi:hypothetical protein